VDGNKGVNEKVVNKLIEKIDGVEKIKKIIVIGMNKRREMIDEELIRKGRLEVKMEIGLKNEKGRVKIISINKSRMRE
jgi:vesicle-fusing ATPase